MAEQSGPDVILPIPDRNVTQGRVLLFLSRKMSVNAEFVTEAMVVAFGFLY